MGNLDKINHEAVSLFLLLDKAILEPVLKDRTHKLCINKPSLLNHWGIVYEYNYWITLSVHNKQRLG